MQPTLNALYYGDCLEWMVEWDAETVDLVYLDPPFNSQSNYNVLFGKTVGGAQYRAFTDTWHWDADAAERMDAYRSAIARPAHAAIVGLERILGPSGMLSYLTYMAERLEHCHRLLKPTGSLYLHCDPTASHYLKIVLDSIFGPECFRNEITWKRTTARSDAKRWGRVHDCILYYARPGAAWHSVYREHDPAYVKRMYRYRDKRGIYRPHDLTAKGLTGGGTPTSFTAIMGRGVSPSTGWPNSKPTTVFTYRRKRAASLVSSGTSKTPRGAW